MIYKVKQVYTMIFSKLKEEDKKLIEEKLNEPDLNRYQSNEL